MNGWGLTVVRLLSDLKIVHEAPLALTAMATFALGATWHAANKLTATDTLHSNLRDQEANAAHWLTRADVAPLDEARTLKRMMAARSETARRGRESGLSRDG